MKTIKTLIIATALAATLGPVSVYAMDQGQKPEKAAAAAQAFTPQEVKQANKNLWTAIDTDNLDRANQALMCGADVSQPDLYGQTPLTRSCCEGRTGMVNFLLNHGAHIDQQNVVCNTPLLEACHKGHIGIVHLLLNRGANVDQVNQYGQTPLIGACREGHTGIVHLLLNHEANVDQVNRYGYTPLSMACNFGRHTAIVKMLVFHGATPSGQESEDMKEVIRQAREARRQFDGQVGDQNWLPQELVESGQLTRFLETTALHGLVGNYADPCAGEQDPVLRELIQAHIRNRQRRIAQERAVATQESIRRMCLEQAAAQGRDVTPHSHLHSHLD
ncbi:MAG: ankyrin repeat domain-containing protein [Candidatus Dependentiae bacterium]|nr:ankyrin repeat domain-containing protein [Candidatus Dependentiae bacterium]